MKGILNVLFIMPLMFGITACGGTLELNHIVTGTDCSTREDCIKDLHLTNPANPEIAFVVDPLVVEQKGGRGGRRRMPIPSFNSKGIHGDVELCIAKALNDEFKNAKIVFDKSDITSPYIDISPTAVRTQYARSGKSYLKIDYEVTVIGSKTSNTAETEVEKFSNVTDAITKQYPEACRILAEQIKKTINNK